MRAGQTPDSVPTTIRSARFHRAWGIVAVAALTIIAAGAFSTMPGLLVNPLHDEFDWSRGSIGFAVWVNMAITGLIAPFVASLMARFGLRNVARGALIMIAVGALLTTTMTAAWQLTIYWGVMIGLGTGSLAITFAVMVVDRWFVQRRGLVTGILTGSSVFGQFIFMPVLASIIETYQWRTGTVTVMLMAITVMPIVWLFLRDHPADVGCAAYGATEVAPKPPAESGAGRHALLVLRQAARTRTFWLLTVTFAICGISTTGIMWIHFVPAAHDHGMRSPVAASLLTMIGIFNIAGSVVSGWLTDRYDPRILLAFYYVSRGVTLMLMPILLGPTARWSLIVIVILFGILDVATVPPTVRLSSIGNTFGNADSAIVFGWTFAAHQVGAGVMAFFGGVIRDLAGAYTLVWIVAGLLSAIAAVMALTIERPVAMAPRSSVDPSAADPRDDDVASRGADRAELQPS